jgi:hypothetical protein
VISPTSIVDKQLVCFPFTALLFTGLTNLLSTELHNDESIILSRYLLMKVRQIEVRVTC